MRSYVRNTINLSCAKILLTSVISPLNAQLNPICHLLELLRAHHILHISRIRVNMQKNICEDHVHNRCESMDGQINLRNYE